METLDDLIETCTILISKCSDFSERNIIGADLLARRLASEQTFLNRKNLKPNQLTCTNLSHYKAIVEAATDQGGGLKRLFYVVAFLRGKIRVDIVADHGLLWIKVFARNAKQIQKNCSGQSISNERNVLDHAKDFVSAAGESGNPMVKFIFSNGVPKNIAENLESMKIIVVGDLICLPPIVQWSSSDEESDAENPAEFGCDPGTSVDCPSATLLPPPGERALNLDVTALMAVISEITHGGAQFVYKETLLNEQAGFERLRPALPFLDSIMEDRQLICCATAWQSFQDILNIVAGEQEKERAERLRNKIKFVPDQPSKRVMNLKIGGKIKDRAKIIFGTGDELNAITVTANKGFVMAAENQGVILSALIHEARALSEQKLVNAVPI